MVEPIGICEKHQLPLDTNGDCEMCRLSELPSKAPPARSPWWALIIPLVLALAGVVWAFYSVGSSPEAPPPRGVPDPSTRPATSAPPPPNRPATEPASLPEAPEPPPPTIDIPTPPSPKDSQLNQVPPRPTEPNPNEIPTWKWDLARRRVNVTMYATEWCPVCKKAREYLHANRIGFTERDTDEDPNANRRLGELNPRMTIPTFQIDDLVYVGFQEKRFETKLNQAARKHL